MPSTISASESLQAPVAGVKPHLQPWEIIAYSPERQGAMYSDWALHFFSQQRYANGLRYFNNSLDLNPFNAKALMHRSQLKRSMGLAPQALKDCHKAEDLLKSRKPPIHYRNASLEVCDALYESNRLENSKINLHCHLRRFNSSQRKPVVDRLNVLNENFRDTLSEDSTMSVQRLINRMMGSLSKQNKDIKDNCDVVSIMEKEEVHLSPLEIARRKRHFKIYNQSYLNKCWVDVAFIKRLRDDPNVQPKHCQKSSEYLGKLLASNYKAERTLTKMLHTRCPMYALNRQKYPDEGFYQRQKEENLYRIQYQTRRNMFKILRSIRLLIRVGEINKLSTFIEEVMGEYVTTKTHRVMPWKFEFTNEVYNYLALARINEYKIPSNMTVLQGRQRLLTLFRLPVNNSQGMRKSKLKQPYTLNITRSATTDPKAEKFKKQVARLENRMRFAEYHIERAYLLHELAQEHLDFNSFDVACSMARKSLEEAIKCKSIIWSFLGLIIICKAHAILGKIEQEKEILTEAFELAKKMKNLDLCLFIDICMRVNAEEMEMKRMTMTSDLASKKKSIGSKMFQSNDQVNEDRNQIT
ncbi:outer dynein arm-docking complex subunit 4 isoform X1 [Drosophila suzukii]|uniref:Outer dynein arm-docking complex subunit 4 isoform X1 n=1 Tax=Drosophila suzukii TaxID=28584 RepID=A0AB40ACF1_DROSZ